MTMTGRRQHLMVAALLLALVACGQAPAPVTAHSDVPSPTAAATTATSPAAATTAHSVGPATSPAPTSPSTSAPASMGGGGFAPCPSPPPRHAALFSYDASGHLRWRRAVPAGGDSSDPVGPMQANGVEYVAVGRTLHAVRVSDGTELWSHAYDEDAYGLWLGGGTVSLLFGQVGTHAQLVGLDPATGATRWTVAIGGRGLFANQAQTADDGLAWIREDGSLQVIDLHTGRLRWSHHLGLSPGLGTVGNVVVYAIRGDLLGYDTSTGALRWTAKVGVGNTELTMAGDLAVLWPNSAGPGISTSDVAVDATTGHVAWSFDRQQFAAVAGSGGGLVFLATYTDRRLYAVDARTGALRWHVATFVAQDSTGVVSGPGLLLLEGGVPDLPQTRVVDRALADGHIRWQRSISGLGVLPRPIAVVADEAVVQVLPSKGDQPSPLTAFAVADGSQRWSADVPLLVDRSPLVDTSGALVAAEDAVYGCAA